MRWLIQIVTVLLGLVALTQGATLHMDGRKVAVPEVVRSGSLVIYKTQDTLPPDLLPRLRPLAEPVVTVGETECTMGSCQDV